MSSFEEQVVEKVDITDLELVGKICKNYKSLGRLFAMWYLYQSDIADNGIPTDSNEVSVAEDGPAILLNGEETAEKQEETVYDLFWKQIDDPEVIDCVKGIFKRAKRYAEKIIVGVREKQTELDAILAKHSERWDIQRMATVDRNIIRAAIYEMKYCADTTPPVVCISEAINIGKTFGAENSRAFINGILNTVLNELFPDRQTQEKSTSCASKRKPSRKSGKD